jgi:hypothetical protein
MVNRISENRIITNWTKGYVINELYLHIAATVSMVSVHYFNKNPNVKIKSNSVLFIAMEK